MIRIKRVYEPPLRGDGNRVLIDGLWPRGIKKESLSSVKWLKEIAPSAKLRSWFKHDPAKWPQFQERYQAELDAMPDIWQSLLTESKKGILTLLYGARDIEHNNALVLKSYLEKKSASHKAR